VDVISSGGTSRATSMATRRSEACRSRSRVISARPSAFAIAVLTSSVKPAMRSSVSAGNRSRVVPTPSAPQILPWTVIGIATTERISIRRRMPASVPGTPR
jgi:hypothetical protein